MHFFKVNIRILVMFTEALLYIKYFHIYKFTQVRCSLCIKNIFFQQLRFSRLFRGRNSCRCFCVEFVKLPPVHRYSVDIFSHSGPSGINGSDAKQNTA